MTQRSRQLAGFTLIEAIAAIVILAVAMPALLFAVTDAQRRRVGPVQDEKARWLAAEKLDDVIADRHSATRGYSYVVNANYPAEQAVSGFAGFARGVNISESDVTLTGAGTGYKTVTVTVTYPAAGGVARAFSLSSVFTDYTP